MNETEIRSNQDDEKSVVTELTHTPDPAYAFFDALFAPIISSKAIETITITNLTTAMKANEQDKNDVQMMNLTLKLSSNWVLMLWWEPIMSIALSFGTNVTKRCLDHNRTPAKQRNVPVKPTKFGMSVRSFGKSHDNMSEEPIQHPHKSRGETKYNRMKTHQKAMIASEPKLACSKIKHITTAS